MKTVETSGLSSRDRAAALLEIRVLASMDHVNIIALRDYFLEGSKLQARGKTVLHVATPCNP